MAFLAILIEITLSFRDTKSFINLIGAAVWAIIFRVPIMLFIGTIPIVALLFVLESFGFHKWWQTICLWALVGLLFGGASSIIAGVFIGVIYWYVSKTKNPNIYTSDQVAESPIAEVTKTQKPSKFKSVRRFFGVFVLLYFIWIIAGTVLYLGKGAWVSLVEPPLGNPPFQMQYDREFNMAMKVALLDFPDEQSCLEKGANVENNEDLLRLDWRKVDTKPEATVCVFRLLSKFGDISKSDDWLKAQGFTMSKDIFNAANPYIEPNGTKRVTGRWAIRKNGLKYKKEFSLRRLLPTIAYGMGVNATYSEDGSTLLFVRIDFSSL